MSAASITQRQETTMVLIADSAILLTFVEDAPTMTIPMTAEFSSELEQIGQPATRYLEGKIPSKLSTRETD